MMKYILLIIMFGLLISQSDENNIDFFDSDHWEGTISYGLFSEKFPVSFLDVSAIFNIDDSNELYGTLSYLSRS